MNGPFILPVRDIVHRPGEMREFELDVPVPEKWGEGLVAVAAGEPIDLSVRLESVHEGILVTADIATRYEGVCGRCLIDIAQPVEVEFQELFGYPGTEATDFEVQDDHVDLEPPVRDAIVLALPFQPVCQPDCPGLDPVTGERLTVEAGHEPAVADPRWAELQNFTRGTEASRPAADNTEKS
ncbi:YceD family protein [Microbacterium sp.]|uniref:YceD family protein n=1 Tax=Microbacterium sp. TaxID=51671 RepID=UPI003221900F